MSRHSDNLERLRNKFGVRLGAQDELCVQLKQELDSLHSSNLPDRSAQAWSGSYRSFIQSCMRSADALQRQERLVSSPEQSLEEIHS